MKDRKHLAIVGATGAVGVEMLRCLEERSVPMESLKLLASNRSAGKKMAFAGRELSVEELTPDSFEDVDLALFSAGSEISRHYAPLAAKTGAIVIDNSSAFRLDAQIPLVIPEINPDDVQDQSGIIANPNCTTIVALMGLHPLHQAWGVRNVIASSYQAVSGSGQAGITELDGQLEALVHGRPLERKVYPHQIASNCIPSIGGVGENGYTSEEMKMQNEGRKILHEPRLNASVTCVRVPVHRSHSVAISAQFAESPDVEEARRLLEEAPGIRVLDDREHNVFPTPLDATHGDDCLVGRIRADLVLERGLSFWVVGDQVRKGAALNAVQIAELFT